MDASEYKEFGWGDDSPKSYHRLFPSPLRGILPADGTPILDIGCGNGYLANLLIGEGYCVYGTDASAEGVAIANRKNPGRFFVSDVAANRLPEELEKIPFHTVMSTEVIEHLYAPRVYVNFVRTILEERGGGQFIVSTPYHGYLKNLLLALSGRMDYHYSALWEGGHIKFWSRATLTRLLAEAGFRDFRFIGVGRMPYLWNHMIIVAKI